VWLFFFSFLYFLWTDLFRSRRLLDINHIYLWAISQGNFE